MDRLKYASSPQAYLDAQREIEMLKQQSEKRYCKACMSIVHSNTCHVCGSLDTQEIIIINQRGFHEVGGNE